MHFYRVLWLHTLHTAVRASLPPSPRRSPFLSVLLFNLPQNANQLMDLSRYRPSASVREWRGKDKNLVTYPAPNAGIIARGNSAKETNPMHLYARDLCMYENARANRPSDNLIIPRCYQTFAQFYVRLAGWLDVGDALAFLWTLIKGIF